MVKGQVIFDADTLQSHQVLEQSRILYQALGDRRTQAILLNLLADIEVRFGHYEIENRLREESLRLWQAVGNLRGVAETFAGLGFMALIRGQTAHGEQLIRQSLAACRKIGEPALIGRSTYTQGLGLRISGKFSQAQAILEESLAIATNLGHHRDIIRATIGLGEVNMDQGRYGQARRYGLNSLSMSKQSADHNLISFALWLLGRVDLAREAYAEANQWLQESVTLHRQMEDQVRLLDVFIYMGFTARGLGDSEQAQRYLAKALRGAINTSHFFTLAPAFTLAALLAADQGRSEQAVELYALASSNPFVGNSRWFEMVAGRTIAAVAATLPAPVAAAAQQRGAGREVWATAKEVLAELEAGQK